MKIIGAGLPRTATLTLKIALEMLGASPCYHMATVLNDTSLVPQWTEALDGTADWHSIFEGFEATVDFPGAYFYREITEAFPEAKVVLSVRDGESWARSMQDTIWGTLWGDTKMDSPALAQCHIDPGVRQFADLMRAMYAGSGLLADDPSCFDPTHAATAMARHNAEVRQIVPRERLLVWSPADGWEPLCEFLDAPVPQVPLPRTNDTREFDGLILGGCLPAPAD